MIYYVSRCNEISTSTNKQKQKQKKKNVPEIKPNKR